MPPDAIMVKLPLVQSAPLYMPRARRNIPADGVKMGQRHPVADAIIVKLPLVQSAPLYMLSRRDEPGGKWGRGASEQAPRSHHREAAARHERAAVHVESAQHTWGQVG